jgi:hypothetical protein
MRHQHVGCPSGGAEGTCWTEAVEEGVREKMKAVEEDVREKMNGVGARCELVWRWVQVTRIGRVV